MVSVLKIAIPGAGGVGGYYGGLLAKSGQDVIFMARGANLAAIKGRGLRIQSIRCRSQAMQVLTLLSSRSMLRNVWV